MKKSFSIALLVCLAAGVAAAGQITKVKYKKTGLEVPQSTPLPVLAMRDQNITVTGQGVNTFTQLEMPPNTSAGVVFRNPAAPEIEFPLNVNENAIGQTLTVKVKYVLGDSNTFRIKVFRVPRLRSVSVTDLSGGKAILKVGTPILVTIRGEGLASVKRAPSETSFFRGVETTGESVVSAAEAEFKVRTTPTAAGDLIFNINTLQHPTGARASGLSGSGFLADTGAPLLKIAP